MTPKAVQERRERAQQKKLEKAAQKAAAGQATSPPPLAGGADEPAAGSCGGATTKDGGDDTQNNGLLPLERIYELEGNDAVLLPKKAGEKFPVGKGGQKITLEMSRAPAYHAKLRKAAGKDGICVRLGILSNGLLSVDFDVDDPELAAKLLELFRNHQPWARHAFTNRGQPNRCQIFFRSSGYPRDKDQLLICLNDENKTVVGELRNGEGNQWQSALTGIHPLTKRYYTRLVEEPAPDIGPWPEQFLPPELKLIRAKDRESNQKRRAAAAAAKGDESGGGAKNQAGDAGLDAFKDCNLLDLNLVRLLEALGLKVTLLEEETRGDEENKYAVECPWILEHTMDGGPCETIVWQLAGGGKRPTFLCAHNHCGDKELGEVLKWAETKKPGVVKRFCMRPELVLPSGTIPYPGSARKLWKGLAPLHRYFFRGNLIMEIVQDKEGRDILQKLTPNALRHRVDLHFRTVAWRVNRTGNYVKKPTRCTHDAAVVLLEATEAAELLPGIETLSSCPVLTGATGLIEVLGKGYHKQCGGIYVFGNLDEVRIPSLTEALLIFNEELLGDYQFVTGSDKARAIASFISPALRAGRLLGEVDFPIDVAQADASQSGKTYRQKLVCAVYGAEPYVITKREGGVGSLDESVSSAILSGVPFILMDNFRGVFNSQFTESCLRGTGNANVRVPHHGELQLPTRYINWMLSSNGVEGGNDFANRTIVTGIRKHKAGYVFKEYCEGADILRQVKGNRERYLGAVFSVVKEWDRAGRPRTGETRHDFREWARALDWIVQKLFGLPALIDGHVEEVLRMSNPSLSWLRQVSIALDRSGGMGTVLDAKEIVNLCEAEGLSIPGAPRDAPDYLLVMQAGRLLGRGFVTSGQHVTVDRYLISRVSKKNQQRHPQTAYHFEYRP